MASSFFLLSLLFVSSLVASCCAARNLNNEIDITWGDGRAQILNNGELLTLSLDKSSGSGFQSKNEYLFGKIDMDLKLVPGNSAGTVTAYYVVPVEQNTQFPDGLRVLAVDANEVCLKLLVRLLEQCRYKVTSTRNAVDALEKLRENKDDFDIVITDVKNLDMDGFSLLDIVVLETDLPVIMISADDSKSTVMKGIRHGARDYLLKPVRLEEIKNIWQHVVRKSLTEFTNNSCITRGEVDQNHETLKRQREEDVESERGEDEIKAHSNGENGESSSHKKNRRLVWTRDLHNKFVDAIEELGDNAVPKKILKVMNVPEISRENVASHLQKFRKMLKPDYKTLQDPYKIRSGSLTKTEDSCGRILSSGSIPTISPFASINNTTISPFANSSSAILPFTYNNTTILPFTTTTTISNQLHDRMIGDHFNFQKPHSYRAPLHTDRLKSPLFQSMNLHQNFLLQQQQQQQQYQHQQQNPQQQQFTATASAAEVVPGSSGGQFVNQQQQQQQPRLINIPIPPNYNIEVPAPLWIENLYQNNQSPALPEFNGLKFPAYNNSSSEASGSAGQFNKQFIGGDGINAPRSSYVLPPPAPSVYDYEYQLPGCGPSSTRFTSTVSEQQLSGSLPSATPQQQLSGPLPAPIPQKLSGPQNYIMGQQEDGRLYRLNGRDSDTRGQMNGLPVGIQDPIIPTVNIGSQNWVSTPPLEGTDMMNSLQQHQSQPNHREILEPDTSLNFSSSEDDLSAMVKQFGTYGSPNL